MIAEATATDTYQSVRPYLFSVAYRMTGSASDAEDLVQDAWIRYLDAGAPDVTSLPAYLTTIVSRLSLDYLKSARVRREQYTGPWLPEPVPTGIALGDPAATVEQRESVSLAFLTLLERLAPEQRVVYVLREGLGLPYDEIAAHVGKSAVACRQIFHRAQRRLEDERRPTIAPHGDHWRLVQRFIEVVQTGDPERIAEVLAQDVVMVGDGGGRVSAQQRPVAGVDNVSRGLAGYARKNAELMRSWIVSLLDVNGAPAAVFLDGDTVQAVLALDVDHDRITGIRAVVNPDKLQHLGRLLADDAEDTE